MAKIIKQTADNDISIFISDCIFSPGKQYKQKDNADHYCPVKAGKSVFEIVET